MTEATDALSRIMQERAFGAAGDRVIIEEYLSGREMSVFAFSDGQSVVPMMAACDYKPVFDGNKGPNTGGMGSYSPPPFLTPSLAKAVQEKIMKPAVEAMHQEGRPYRGILYGGLMISDDSPKVLEFNARFGDPEAQVTLPLIETDLVDIMLAVSDNRLDQIEVQWSQDACVGVVMASGGYPGSYKSGFAISGLDELDKDIVVFHAGTRLGADGEVLTSGGRVLTVMARGKTLTEARQKVYANVPRIKFEGSYYRQDIALIK
jgi:phosphoribosylamine--glycine ligase